MADKTDFPQAAEGAQSGTIRPPLLRAWFGTLLGLMMLLIALWAAIVNNNGDVATAMAFLGLVFVGASAPQVAWDHEVRWSQRGIEGPAKMFGLTLGATRTEIAWSDIVRTGGPRQITGMSNPVTVGAFTGAIFARDTKHSRGNCGDSARIYLFDRCEVQLGKSSPRFALPRAGTRNR